ncbi:MAG: hypothetical protein MSS75_00925 [Megasphaera sp.]|uniref:hypothetical protein n=1 Tax=Megasphaera sp. TaxID=2023260 RepID=UPI0025C17CA4|nr:hypothetical protein [Megasphaera sp.]MCF0151773.1 hypothetical protein [Megasphaera sp.]MCI7599609.1 hypothetical protein [Megasphaera sp.]
MKKTTFIAVCVFVLWTALALPAVPSSVQAAKGGGGVRVSAPKSLPAPKAVTPQAGTTKNTAPKTGNTKGDGQTQTRKAETTQPRTGQTASSSRLGSVMRGIGLFAGGMFLGSMLSHLFGWGSLGWGADILGLLVNIFIFYLVIKGLSALWRWLRSRRR